MTSGPRTVIYPVSDVAKAKTLYGRLLGVAPALEAANYVHFTIGDQEVGLVPDGHSKGMTAPIAYWHVENIEERFAQLLDAGAEARQEVTAVGGEGRLIASVADADGNVIGLLQPA